MREILLYFNCRQKSSNFAKISTYVINMQVEDNLIIFSDDRFETDDGFIFENLSFINFSKEFVYKKQNSDSYKGNPSASEMKETS